MFFYFILLFFHPLEVFISKEMKKAMDRQYLQFSLQAMFFLQTLLVGLWDLDNNVSQIVVAIGPFLPDWKAQNICRSVLIQKPAV